MAKSILDEALEDTKLLRETAIENAKNVLVEAISPQIREFFDSQVGGGSLSEMPAELSDLDPATLEKLIMMLKSVGLGGMHDDNMGSMEVGMGEPEGELPYEDEVPEEGMYETAEMTQEEKEDEDEEGDKEMDEVVKIDEQDLAKAWAEVVREEALDEAAQVPSPTVSAEFADAQNPNKNAEGGLGEPGAPGERGLEDKEKQEMWKDHEPPASQDWTVKEHMYKKQIELLQVENKKLKSENNQLNVGVEKLQRSLTEVNLFNSKLLFTNKLLQNTSLTNEQRLSVIEAFDRAESLREVELVYKSLSESFKIAGVLSEGKQPSGKKQRSSRFTTSATANMLREQSEKVDDAGETISERWQTLAGVLGD